MQVSKKSINYKDYIYRPIALFAMLPGKNNVNKLILTKVYIPLKVGLCFKIRILSK